MTTMTNQLCDGCDVREPFEHRCHGEPCPCEECREADRIFGTSAIEPGGGDVEALAWAINDAEDGGKTTPTYTEMARHVLASDWLAAHDAEVRRTAAKETAERIAEAIRALRADAALPSPMSYRAALSDALRIARAEAD